MEISADDAIKLIADLWIGKLDLTKKYFGKYLGHLLTALQETQFEEHFVQAAFVPYDLEKRLEKIESLGLTKAIVAEVGNINDPQELDKRLVDAWAEIRVIDQLLREDFENIRKKKAIADLLARKDCRSYAFQVTRINKSLSSEVEKRNKPPKRDSSPYGTLSDIHERLDGPISYFFWDALERKSIKFKSWENNDIRCIVIVSSDDVLQDEIIRKISCQQIREGIRLLNSQNFEELLWLPDLGNGALFKINSVTGEIQCFADWKDDPSEENWGMEDYVNRREVNLDSSMYSWKG